MAVAGAKPKDQKVTRTPTVHDWTEVIDEPYAGNVPALGRAPAATKAWWAVVSTMPHCILWAPADWQFALDTARVHAAFAKGKLTAAAELRVREKQMGTTIDARRDLRIRYVAPAVEAETHDGTGMADFEAERRRRLLEATD